MAQRLPPSAPGLGGQLVAAALGLVFVISLITLGFVVFFVAMLLGTVFWMVFLVRRWWLSRGAPQAVETKAGRGAGDTLEGEFKVVGKSDGDPETSVRRRQGR